MFASFMMTTWIAGTAVAIVAGLVGFFVVLRGASFLAHAIPHGAFAGAAGAVLIGASPLFGLGVFAVGGALAVTAFGRRVRQDVAVAMTLVTMLGLGALFLSLSSQYSSEVYALLFGQILGISPVQLVPTLILGALTVVALGVLYRPLLLASALPDVAASRGVRPGVLTLCFTLVVAIATTMSVPVVGALLMFSLLIGPAAAARSLTRHPLSALAVSAGLAVLTVWVSIAAAYETDWPIGFFVTAISAVCYLVGRVAVRLGSGRRQVTTSRGAAAS